MKKIEKEIEKKEETLKEKAQQAVELDDDALDGVAGGVSYTNIDMGAPGLVR